MQLKELKHIPQHGPTCGIYCFAMILQAIKTSKDKIPSDQDLALELLNLAIENNKSNIGEFFSVDDLVSFIELVNDELLDSKVSVFSVSFNDYLSMKNKIKKFLSRLNTYIIFPILPANHFKYVRCGKRRMDIAHWVVINACDDKKISVIYSQKAELFHRKKFKFKRIYRRNSLLTSSFNWDYFYKFSNYKESKHPVLDKVSSASQHHKNQLFNGGIANQIKYNDLANKMIVIQQSQEN